MNMPKLDTRPRRQDLTDRECTSLLGGLLGALCENADPKTVRAAVRWWAQNDAAWDALSTITTNVACVTKDS